MKLFKHAKNKLIPLVNSILEASDQIGHINLLKMRLFHQLAQEKAKRILDYISGTQFFPKDLFRNKTNKNFQYRINARKINDQIFL